MIMSPSRSNRHNILLYFFINWKTLRVGFRRGYAIAFTHITHTESITGWTPQPHPPSSRRGGDVTVADRWIGQP